MNYYDIQIKELQRQQAELLLKKEKSERDSTYYRNRRIKQNKERTSIVSNLVKEFKIIEELDTSPIIHTVKIYYDENEYDGSYDSEYINYLSVSLCTGIHDFSGRLKRVQGIMNQLVNNLNNAEGNSSRYYFKTTKQTVTTPEQLERFIECKYKIN